MATKLSAYLVERSLAGLSDKQWSTLQLGLDEASRKLTASGRPVRYMGSTFVPARSRCFCRFDAVSLDVVKAVNEAALVPYLAIDEAIEFPAASEVSNGRRRPSVSRKSKFKAAGGTASRAGAKEVNGMSQQATITTEKLNLKGAHLVENVKELIHEGNVRKIIVKDSHGETVMELPVTIGLAGFLAAPKMAALGAFAAIAADFSIEVERESPE